MKISDRVTRLETLVPEIHAKLESLDTKMDGMDHLIRGNGSPGLAAKVENLLGAHRIIRDVLCTIVGGVIVGILVSMFSSGSHRNVKNMPEMQQKP